MIESRAKANNKYVLIDDDPIYQTIMSRFAKDRGMHLDVYDSLSELGSVGLLGQYDAAIVDYDLGSLNGVEIAEYLSALFGDIPMILVSERQRDPGSKPWPKSIKSFIQKSQGYDHVLKQTLKLIKSGRDERSFSFR